MAKSKSDTTSDVTNADTPEVESAPPPVETAPPADSAEHAPQPEPAPAHPGAAVRDALAAYLAGRVAEDPGTAAEQVLIRLGHDARSAIHHRQDLALALIQLGECVRAARDS